MTAREHARTYPPHGAEVLDFETSLHTGDTTIITESYSAQGLWIWVKDVKAVTFRWFQQQCRRLFLESNAVVAVSFSAHVDYFTGFYSFMQNPRTTNSEPT
jgi:hypothetical protein